MNAEMFLRNREAKKWFEDFLLGSEVEETKGREYLEGVLSSRINSSDYPTIYQKLWERYDEERVREHQRNRLGNFASQAIG